MILGRVDEIDGHYVGTRFLLGLLPLECVYVSAPGTRSTRTDGRIRIRTDWRSVGIAYGRSWLPVLAILLPIAELATGARHLFTWVLSGVLTALSVRAFRAGKLPEPEVVRLRLLGSVTGLRIDPRKLEPALRQVKRDSLGDLMDKGGIPTTPEGILTVIDEIPVPAMPLVYGFACYAGDDPAWRECAAIVYSRCELES